VAPKPIQKVNVGVQEIAQIIALTIVPIPVPANIMEPVREIHATSNAGIDFLQRVKFVQLTSCSKRMLQMVLGVFSQNGNSRLS
jgi:hypothetical protein